MKQQTDLPPFESTAAAVSKTGQEILEWSKKRTLEISQQDLSKVTFESVMGALEDLSDEEDLALSRIYFLNNVHPKKDVRDAAQNVQLEFQDWAIEKAYDEKTYKAVLAIEEKYKKGEIKLEGEAEKLLDETLKDYRRMGMNLPKDKLEILKQKQKELSKIETEFSSAINEYQTEWEVEAGDLEGIDPGFLGTLKRAASGRYLLHLDYPEYLPVMEHAKSEHIRRDMLTRKYNAAREPNVKLLREMVKLRHEIAELLGYQSWNHYILEDRMAKTPERVLNFLNDLQGRLKEKAKKELEDLVAIKREQSSDKNAKVEIWDYYYLSSQHKMRKYSIDTQALREFFPLTQAIDGMFSIYSELFSIRFEQVKDNFPKWADDVLLYRVFDEANELRGYFYMDLHPREGKYNHAAAFGLVDGMKTKTGYRPPVSAMVCNFPAGTKSQPSLIPHAEVETLFHEFGHILHGILTRAKFPSFAGTSVARDFVEAPSQILENWVWEYDSLSRFALHHKTGKKIDPDLVQKMQEAKKAGSAMFYLRQIALAKADLEIHSGTTEDPSDISNRVMKEVFLSVPDDTVFAASWGHMVGYASGYYGYAWSDVMAADMFSFFRKNGLFDRSTGLRLRKEIYEPGSSRDENESLEKFLGRPLSSEAFFSELGAA